VLSVRRRAVSRTRRVIVLLVVEPTVVLPQQFVERCFNILPERSSCGSSSTGVLKSAGCYRVFQNAWTVCRIGRPVRSSVGGGRASCAASRVSDRLERVLERRPVWDRRLAVWRTVWVSSDIFFCVELSVLRFMFVMW